MKYDLNNAIKNKMENTIYFEKIFDSKSGPNIIIKTKIIEKSLSEITEFLDLELCKEYIKDRKKAKSYIKSRKQWKNIAKGKELLKLNKKKKIIHLELD